MEAIADKMGVSQSRISEGLAKFEKILLNSSELLAFRANKIDLLDSVQFRLLEGMADEGRLEKASLNNVAYALAQVGNERRLEAGQPTQIVEARELMGLMIGIRGQIEVLEGKIGLDDEEEHHEDDRRDGAGGSE